MSDKIYVGCPGCEVFNIKLFPNSEIVNNDKKLEVNINLENFLGGHSGATIQNGQANPIKWITHILNCLNLIKLIFKLWILKEVRQ